MDNKIMDAAMADGRIRLGVSSCLLGNKVRYDGGHKLDPYLTGVLGRFVDFVPVCPEVESGFPVPREAFRLVGDPADPRLIVIKTGQDFTATVQDWAARRLDELAALNLCGFVFKSKSPNSGMERVKVYPEGGGIPANKGVGIFARMFMARFPYLPVEEEGRLHDLKLRETFIEAVFVMHRWREFEAGLRRPADLMDFHTRHKLLVFTHSERHYRQMGGLVAGATRDNMDRIAAEYYGLLMSAMRLPTTRRKNVCALEKTMGYFRKLLTSDEKQELLEVFAAYRAEHVPLIVPVTLINHYVRKYDEKYLRGQLFLNPHPLELQLRNHV